MASFDENGKYIKTNWKAGDKITATKLNKIEESIEAVNDNDISRHVEADARLDALEAKDVAHDKELTNIKNTIADNKAAAELGDYDINSRMTFLEDELNEGIEEVHNVASTVDGKIATAEANMAAQVNQGKADMEAMVAEVEADLEGLHAKDEELSEQLENISIVSTNDLQLSLNDAINNNNKLKLRNEKLIFSNIKFIGTGLENLELTGSLNNIIESDLEDASSEKAIIYLSNLDNIKIDNLRCRWNGYLNLKNKQSILKIENCNNVIITDCELFGSNKNGLEIKNCKNVYINGGKYHNNYHCGIEYSNVDYITINGATLIENGDKGDYSDGYGIAQATSEIPSRQVIITNCKVKGNSRKGIDCHEFDKIIISSNIIEESGISGIACQTDVYNADSIIISDNIINNQKQSNYASESAISVDTTGSTIINNIMISNNIIKEVVGYGIVVKGNGSKTINITDNEIVDNDNGYTNGQVIRIIESSNFPENVIISNNNIHGGNGKGVVVDCAKHLLVNNNVIFRNGSSLLLHFPTKTGDNSKVINATIEGNILRGAGDYFSNGWSLTGSDGVITDNRADTYIYNNNVIINNNANTSFPLWDLNKGLKTYKGVKLTSSVGSTGNWVLGDKFIDTSNIITNGYIGKVYNGAEWKYFGKIEE